MSSNSASEVTLDRLRQSAALVTGPVKVLASYYSNIDYCSGCGANDLRGQLLHTVETTPGRAVTLCTGCKSGNSSDPRQTSFLRIVGQ